MIAFRRRCLPPPLRGALVLTLAALAAAYEVAAADSVDASPTVRFVRPNPSPSAASKPSPSGTVQLELRVGEVRAIHVSERRGDAATAFYLPPEGVPYVQISYEKTFSKVTYFARGLRPGKTVGGIVDKRWLDSTGFTAGSISNEVRVQDAIKSSPIFITVR